MYKKIPTVTPGIHPLVAGAAISVTALCIVATIAIVGWLPVSNADMPDDITVSAPVPANTNAAQVPPQYSDQPHATPAAAESASATAPRASTI
jgi:hypothetical protein